MGENDCYSPVGKRIITVLGMDAQMVYSCNIYIPQWNLHEHS